MYRYVYVYPTTGSLGFDGRWFDHSTYALHLSLSLSSLIFEVLHYRIMAKPLIIW